MDDGATGSPFPSRASSTIHVDSVGEEYAYIAAWPASSGPWERVSQVLVSGGDGPEDHLTLRSPDGTTVVISFAVGSFFGRPAGAGATPGERVSAAMRAGHDLAKREGPLHPGTTPLFPVPSPAHAGSIAVPLPVVGVDSGRRGLYAPPRIAVVRWPSAAAIGVGDLPGFDPTRWPPSFLGEWPPPAMREWDTRRRTGAVERFSAIWGRLLDAWVRGEDYAARADETREARLLLHRLVPAPMLALYGALSPDFWHWSGIADDDAREAGDAREKSDPGGQTP